MTSPPFLDADARSLARPSSQSHPLLTLLHLKVNSDVRIPKAIASHPPRHFRRTEHACPPVGAVPGSHKHSCLKQRKVQYPLLPSTFVPFADPFSWHAPGTPAVACSPTWAAHNTPRVGSGWGRALRGHFPRSSPTVRRTVVLTEYLLNKYQWKDYDRDYFLVKLYFNKRNLIL